LTSIVIKRLFDGLTVVTCLEFGLLLAAAAREGTGILLDVLATRGILFTAILLAALWLSGSTAPRAISRFPRLSARLGMVQKGFGILRTWRILEIAILTLVTYLPDALSLWFLVKAVGLALAFGDTLVLVGVAGLSTLVPSGPAFLGTLQFAYMLAIGFAGGPHAVGIAAATLAQLCLLLPVSLIATGILTHGSGRLLASLLKGRSFEAEEPRPEASEVAAP
jgi:uncharacterized membrane protein YbhN (UPF0104 family)